MSRSAESEVDVSDRIESAILSARAVAATPEAQELARRTGGKHGTWTREDEANLRAGFMMIWNENRRQHDRLDLPSMKAARTAASPPARPGGRPSPERSREPAQPARGARAPEPQASARASGGSRA